MSDESSAEIRDSRKNWMVEHREMYLRSGGAEGHIMDLTAVGAFRFGTHCLIKYTGRNSGRSYITPLCYGVSGGEVLIIASKGGADQHPDWYLNLREHTEIPFQIGTQAFRGTWREPAGAERDKLWQVMVDCYPFYANYQKSTQRVIPVIAMQAHEEIPVFTEADATGVRDL